MRETICGVNCAECANQKECKGCTSKKCFIARYITIDGKEKLQDFKQKLMDEFNELNIPGMPKVNELYPLAGNCVNLAYTLPSGEAVKLLDDDAVYFGNQLECEFGGERCYGIVAGSGFLLVSEYGENGAEPEVVMYKRR